MSAPSPFERWAWCTDTPLSGSGTGLAAKRALLLILGRFTNSDGECFPAQTTLRERSGLGKTTLIKALAALETEGKIKRVATRRKGESGKQVRGVDRYLLLIDDQGSSGEPTSPTKVHLADDQGSSGERTKVREVNRKKRSQVEGAKEKERARDLFEEIFTALPVASQRGSSPDRMRKAWEALERRPEPADLLEAARNLAANDPERPKQAHWWITDRAFELTMPRRTAPGGRPIADWRAWVETWRNEAYWPENLLGPPPGDPRCQCPAEVLEPGYTPPPPRDATGMPELGYCG